MQRETRRTASTSARVAVPRSSRESWGALSKGLFRFSSRTPAAFVEGNRHAYPPIYLNQPQRNATELFPSNAMFTTKYTLLTFLPKLLYEQFRRITTVYFFFICIISTIPSISPISPLSSWVGFIFIIVVAAVREAYEDYVCCAFLHCFILTPVAIKS